MPASGVRFVMFIHDGRKGISESHVYQTADIATAKPFAINLFKLRMQLCGPPAVPFRGRLSLVTKKRATRLLGSEDLANVGFPAPGNMAGDTGNLGPNNSDQPNAAVLLTLYSADDSKRPLYLAGIPDPVIVENPEGPHITFIPGYLAKFNAYRNELITQAWGFIGRVTDIAVTLPKQVVAILKPNVNGNIFAVINGATTIATAQKIQLSNFRPILKPYKMPNGIFEAGAVTENSPIGGQSQIEIRGTKDIDPATVKDPGIISIVDYTFRKYSSVQIGQQTTRKRGNRFLSGPGRRTKPVKLSL